MQHRVGACLLGLATLIAAALTAPGPASAGGCLGAGQPPNLPNRDNRLDAVTVLGDCSAWAVGAAGPHTLIERWNGTAWHIVASPADGWLRGADAVSATDVWAVGVRPFGANNSATLIERWRGTAWHRFAAPGASSTRSFGLVSVSASSAANAWAVGSSTGPLGGGVERSYALRWTGAAWHTVVVPHFGAPGEDNTLSSVVALSAHNVWAVGEVADSSVFGGTLHSLVLHWNGQAWHRVHVPERGNLGRLYGVSASGPHDVWAVGEWGQTTNGAGGTLAVHWTGSGWSILPSPHPSSIGPDVLHSVVVLSPTDAWAVGTTEQPSPKTLVAHWNGIAWHRVASTNRGTASELLGVDATSSANLWAVGDSSRCQSKSCGDNPRTYNLAIRK